jgi:uncharacterized membrane protein YfcA
LAYVNLKTRNVLVVSLAHIVLNNASASFGYAFVIQDAFWANLGTVLVMMVVVGVLYVTGQFEVFRTTRSAREPEGEACAAS